MMRFRTDDEAITFDVAALLAAGRFTEALVPAALQADRLGVIPRSLTFLAEIVRRGGVTYAAGLAEPLPTPSQTELVRPWLEQVGAGEPGVDESGADGPGADGPGADEPGAGGARWGTSDDERLARWLDGVAAIIEARHLTAR
jgi:hypothetical protein